MNCLAKQIIYIFCFCLITKCIQAQPDQESNYPKIGKPCPEFVLKDVQYFAKKQVSLNDFQGKPLILDFFAVGCTSCFTSFPKINELQHQFNDKLQIILVGKEHRFIRSSYERFREKYELKLPVVYDTIVFNQFKISGVPHVVWIDKNGIVKAVTSSSDVNKKNLELFIDGKDFQFEDYSYDASKDRWSKFDYTKGFLINGNGGNDEYFIQRSLLAKWEKGMPAFVATNIDRYVSAGLDLQVLGLPLTDLYRLAYFGEPSDWFTWDTLLYAKYHYSPILEVKDPAVFKPDKWADAEKFSYSQILPPEKRTATHMMEVMQRDLKNFFGYDVSIETRKMPYLKLVATDEAKIKLKTRGGKTDASNSVAGVNFTNVPVSGTIVKDGGYLVTLVHVISYNAYLVSKDLPLIDETGIKGNIDISFEAVMTDWEDIKKALQKQGLDLVKGEKDMKVIVIRDAK